MPHNPTFSVRLSCAAVLLVVAATAFAAQTPTLADVARQEAERRKAQPASGKVYTNKDLPPSAVKPATRPAEGEALPPADPVAVATEQNAEAQAKAKAGAEQKPAAEEKNEAWWKARIMQAREELRRNEIFAEALQSRINALTREYANPMNAPRQRLVAQQRVEAVNELSRVAQDIERAKKQVADIEEEARVAGVPPGWLR